MKDGLKLQLFEFIRKYDYVTYQAIEDKAQELGYKTETATRRLRELCSRKNGHIPLIEEVLSPKKAIIGYRYIGIPKPVVETKKEQATLFPVQPKRLSHYDV